LMTLPTSDAIGVVGKQEGLTTVPVAVTVEAEGCRSALAMCARPRAVALRAWQGRISYLHQAYSRAGASTDS
jgi:flavin-dependent dehydrogenase